MLQYTPSNEVNQPITELRRQASAYETQGVTSPVLDTGEVRWNRPLSSYCPGFISPLYCGCTLSADGMRIQVPRRIRACLNVFARAFKLPLLMRLFFIYIRR